MVVPYSWGESPGVQPGRPILLSARRSCLLVVDVQTKLAPAVAEGARAISNAAVLMRGAARLGVPVLISEHYPKGLGSTVPALAELVSEDSIVEKIRFSAAREQAFRARLHGLNRGQIVVAGMETHVCVLQTALALREDGHEVFVVADAVSSRRLEDRAVAIERMQAEGCRIVTTEMVIFEWLERGDAKEFRELLALIK